MDTTLLVGQRDGSLGAIAKWWRNWKRRYASARELDCCGSSEVAHLAQDLGVSAAELRTLAGRWPDSPDLLHRRIDALGLDVQQIRHDEPEALRDLQRVCSQCADERRCEHDLRRGAGDEAWRDYCPNVGTLDALGWQEQDRRSTRGERK